MLLTTTSIAVLSFFQKLTDLISSAHDGVSQRKYQELQERRHRLLINLLEARSLRRRSIVGLEVGVQSGNFSIAQLAGGHQRLHLVDPWRHLVDWKKPANVKQGAHDALYRSVLERVVRRFGSDRVIVHRNTSEAAALEFADESLDYIYIDGDHTVGGVLADCLLWWPKLKPGGLFFGDDFTCSLQHGMQYDPTCVSTVVRTMARVAWGNVTVLEPGLEQFAIDKPRRARARDL